MALKPSQRLRQANMERDFLGRLQQVSNKIAAFTSILQLTFNQLERHMAKLEDIEREVSEVGNVIDSAIVLINGLSQSIKDAKNDPARLDAITKELDTKAGLLAAAVAANTPTATLSSPTATEPAPAEQPVADTPAEQPQG